MAAKEYLDKAGLKRLVELLKGELAKVEAQKGEDGKSITYVDKYLPYDVTGGLLYLTEVKANEFGMLVGAGELFISKDGSLYESQGIGENGLCIFKWRTSVKGESGADGKSILYYNDEWGTTNIGPVDTKILNKAYFLEEPKDGDIAITKDGMLLEIKEFSSDSKIYYSGRYITTLKGANGKDGKSILYYDSIWGISGNKPMSSMMSEDSYYSETPNEGDLAISKDGVLFRVGVAQDSSFGEQHVAYYVMPLKGIDGKDGKSILFYDGMWPVTITGIPNESVLTFVGTFSETPKDGDIAISKNGILFKLAVTSGTTTGTYLLTIKGTNGTTPHIGENGNWWIGETDTGVVAGVDPDEYATTEYVDEKVGNINTALEAILGV